MLYETEHKTKTGEAGEAVGRAAVLCVFFFFISEQQPSVIVEREKVSWPFSYLLETSLLNSPSNLLCHYLLQWQPKLQCFTFSTLSLSLPTY